MRRLFVCAAFYSFAATAFAQFGDALPSEPLVQPSPFEILITPEPAEAPALPASTETADEFSSEDASEIAANAEVEVSSFGSAADIETSSFVQKITQEGRDLETGQLLSGDRVRISVRCRNKGSSRLRNITITQPIPDSVTYIQTPVPETRASANTDISYSVDQGRSFSVLGSLKVHQADSTRLATAADVNSIRWVRGLPLRPAQTVVFSFQAIIK